MVKEAPALLPPERMRMRDVGTAGREVYGVMAYNEWRSSEQPTNVCALAGGCEFDIVKETFVFHRFITCTDFYIKP